MFSPPDDKKIPVSVWIDIIYKRKEFERYWNREQFSITKKGTSRITSPTDNVITCHSSGPFLWTFSSPARTAKVGNQSGLICHALKEVRAKKFAFPVNLVWIFSSANWFMLLERNKEKVPHSKVFFQGKRFENQFNSNRTFSPTLLNLIYKKKINCNRNPRMLSNLSSNRNCI